MCSPFYRTLYNQLVDAYARESMCVRIRIDMHVLHPQALIHRSACAYLSFGGDKSHGHTVDWTQVQLTHPKVDRTADLPTPP